MVFNEVSTLAGTGEEEHEDGHVSEACFTLPTSLALNYNGKILVVDSATNCIRKISTDGNVSTLAGNHKKQGYKDGVGKAANFLFTLGHPGVVFDRLGNLILSDQDNRTIRRISSDGTVSTLAGIVRQSGHVDGPALCAQFSCPAGLVYDDIGNLYVSEANVSHCIRKITPSGIVSTWVGNGEPGFSDGQGRQAKFNTLGGMTIDVNGNILVCDTGNNRIRKISPTGMVTTLAGNGRPGLETGPGNSACMNGPQGLSLDGDGNVIVADTWSHRILKITSDGTVHLLAGTSLEGRDDGPGETASFRHPTDVQVDHKGNVIVADFSNNCIRMIAANLTPPQHLAPPESGTGELVQLLSEYVGSSEYSDVEVLVGESEQVFPAHRLILSRSPFFQAAFTNEFIESSERKILLKDIGVESFRIVLDYLYTNNLCIPADCDVLALRSAAEFLALAKLQQCCELEIQKRICTDNLARCYRYAKVNSMSNLKRQCIDIATSSASALASVQLTAAYAVIKSDEELTEEFLEECQSRGES